MGNKDSDGGTGFLIGALAGLVGGIIADETLSVPKRIESAAKKGYEIGKAEKETELRPQIDSLQKQNIDLRNTVSRKEQEAIDREQTVLKQRQEIAQLKAELEKTKGKS